MIDRREDSDRVLPATAPVVRAVSPGHAGLSVAGAARSDPFLVTGDRCWLTGVQTRDGVEAHFDFGHVTVSPGLGTAANHIVHPGLVQREFVTPRGSVREIGLCAPALPLAVVQWSGEGAPSGIAISVAPKTREGSAMAAAEPFSPLATAEQTGWGALLSLPGDRHLAILIVPNPGRLDIDDSGFLHVEETAQDTTVVLAAGDRAEVRRALAAAPHLSGHALRATGGPDREGLVVESGVTELDEGVSWLRARLAATLRRSPADRPDERLNAGLAALAAGDEAVAYAALDLLPADGPRAAALAGRISMALGDAGPATIFAERLVGAETSGWEPSDPWHAAALAALAAGLHNSAPDLVDALTTLRAREAAAATPGGGRRLPVVGARPAPRSDTQRLMELIDGGPEEPGERTPSGGGSPPVPERALLPWTVGEGFRSDPESSWRLWREQLGAGLENGPEGPATWDHPDVPGGFTGSLILAFVHGCLGIGQDAASGRLRIAPRLPSHLTRLAVGGIRIGGARLRFDFEREGPLLRYSFIPEFAGVPPLIVFEPSLGPSVESVAVDGVPAQLDRRTEYGRTIVPVQFPLDGPRTIEISFA